MEREGSSEGIVGVREGSVERREGEMGSEGNCWIVEYCNIVLEELE